MTPLRVTYDEEANGGAQVLVRGFDLDRALHGVGVAAELVPWQCGRSGRPAADRGHSRLSGSAGVPPSRPMVCSPASARRNRTAGRSSPIHMSATAGGSVSRATSIRSAVFTVESKIPTAASCHPRRRALPATMVRLRSVTRPRLAV
jgi:hypothetical protein